MADHGANEVKLFWACFFSIVATAFGFAVRGQIINVWGKDFNLDETQKGVIFGTGLWPFSVSIVLFSLIIDKIGYGKAMAFAFACHVGSAILTIFAQNYAMLWLGTFICALGNGTVEAVANPVVATMFPREKTKWLNILHAGWPGGLVLGGILSIAFTGMGWKYQVGLILLPTALYGVMMLGRHFPIHERVQHGVSYLDMLKEAGFVGAAVVVYLISAQLVQVLRDFTGNPTGYQHLELVISAILIIGYAAYVKSPGRPMFIFLVLVMIPLATTELGTDSWITPLMTSVMEKLGANPGWLLIYTSFIMMVLRFFAGSIVHRISPLGLLAASATIACLGLLALSQATGIGILVAATLYAFGKTFFWPTTLGVVSEQFPKGGALTMNMIAGVGMLGVGILGAPFIGNIQDKRIDHAVMAAVPEIHSKVAGDEKSSVLGKYVAIDPKKVEALSPDEKTKVTDIQEAKKKETLAIIAILPAIMLACYLILIFYFKSKGGYKPVQLDASGS
ncbi:MFS transporter [Candidatus Sumerlaeota bacterium]|nr:MFS transporter [Candidatus Sumerlaeota bacterium]